MPSPPIILPVQKILCFLCKVGKTICRKKGVTQAKMLNILLLLTAAGLRFDQLQSVLSIYCFIIPLVNILGNCATSKLLCLHLHAKKTSS